MVRPWEVIRKLLAKAERAATPDEADAYNTKAADLMARHGVDAAMVAAGGDTRDVVTDYTDQLGGYERMLAHHRGLEITAEQRFRFVDLMSRAADDAELPHDPEFRSALLGYLEWGTRLAMHNSQPDARIVANAPVPRWGWGVAPPYQP